MTKYINPEAHWQPWYDDRRDYNTNAPTYYDYLANKNKLTKEIVDVVNEELGRDVDFLDSDEIHVDKLTDWHDDDPNHENKTTFKAHVIVSPKTLTYSLDNVDYQASNALKVIDSGLYTPDFSQVISQQTARLNEASTTANRAETKADNAQKTADTAKSTADTAKITANNNTTRINSLENTKQDKLTSGYGISIEDNVIKAPLFTRLENGTDLNSVTYGFVRGDQLINAPTTGKWYIQSMSDGLNSTQIAWNIRTSTSDTPITYRRDKVNNLWTAWYKPTNLVAGHGIDISGNTISTNIVSTAAPLPEQYKFHKFSNILTSGDWGFQFVNDTDNKVYYVKLKVGIITNAGTNSVIATQNKQTLINAGVPSDFLEKATNEYVFRIGYFIGDTLNRIAIAIKTVGDTVQLIYKYSDVSGNIENQQIVEDYATPAMLITYS